MQLIKGLIFLAGLTVSGPGEIAWQIQGSLTKDAFHRLYQLRSSEQGSQLARVDGRTGATLWEIQGQAYIDFNADCVDANRVYLLDDDRVQARDADSGKVIWTEHVNQEFLPNAGYLNCFRSSEQLFLSYSLDQRTNNKLAAVRKTDGKTLWTYESQQPIHLIGADAERIYFRRSVDSFHLTHALDQHTGHELWVREDTDSYFQWDAWERLLRHGQDAIARIDKTNGLDMWRISIPGSYNSSQSLSDAIYVQSDAGVTRVHPDSGVPHWEIKFTPNAERETSTLILKNGDVLLRESPGPQQEQTLMRVLSSVDGQTLWERNVEGRDAFVTEDRDGHLFEQTSSTLSLLDHKGDVLWSFQVPALHGKLPRIGHLMSAEQQLLVTLFEGSGKYPPTSVAAVDWQNGTLNWIHEANEPLLLISLDQPSLIILRSMFSGRSFALYQ